MNQKNRSLVLTMRGEICNRLCLHAPPCGQSRLLTHAPLFRQYATQQRRRCMPSRKKQWYFYSEYGRRLLILRRMLRITELQWNCYAALIQDKRPISEASLAAHLNSPRITVRAVIVLGVENGFIERTPAGLSLTALGLLATEAVHSDTYEIVMGTRRGYSESTVEILKSIVTNTRSRARIERLRQVYFYPTIRPPPLKKVA